MPDTRIDAVRLGLRRSTTEIRSVRTDDDVEKCAQVALASHSGLRARYPWLPERGTEDFTTRIGWVAREGWVLGAFVGDELAGYVGALSLEHYRFLGPASLTPDWCLGVADGVDVVAVTRDLVRAALADLDEANRRIHAVGVHAHRDDVREQLELTGYGRIVVDAARPTSELRTRLEALPPVTGTSIRRAGPADAPALAAMDGRLVAHLVTAPVLMPIPDEFPGHPVASWVEWLAQEEAVAFVAEVDGVPVGFMKAQEPQLDVSFTVHGAGTLAINGAWVDPGVRRRGLSTRLLAAVVDDAHARGKGMVSVDCETANTHAYGFWRRWFEPVTWSLERRW